MPTAPLHTAAAAQPLQWAIETSGASPAASDPKPDTPAAGGASPREPEKKSWLRWFGGPKSKPSG